MTRWILMVALVFSTFGCATHYYTVRGGTMEIFLDKPDARSVMFACSLDGFEPHRARKKDGQWVVALPSDCQFRYYYVLDGKMYVPECRMKENDDLGSENCIFDPYL